MSEVKPLNHCVIATAECLQDWVITSQSILCPASPLWIFHWGDLAESALTLLSFAILPQDRLDPLRFRVRWWNLTYRNCLMTG